MKRLLREIAEGIIIASVIIFTVYLVFNLSFYELYLQYRLTLSAVNLQTEQILSEADYQANEMFLKEKRKAQKELFSIRKEWLNCLDSAQHSGLKEVAATYLAYTDTYNKARARYKNKLKTAKDRSQKLRKDSKHKVDSLIKKAKEEANPLGLLIMGKINKEIIKGYLYDPVTGKIDPILIELPKNDKK